ncbi:MAG: YtxH domain-containing protein [Rikenellaceae bacterium]
MKKTLVILGSVVGGAVLGSALTMCVAPKTGADMRKAAHKKIAEQLDMIKKQIEGCTSMMMEGACKCNTDSKSEMPMVEEQM